MSWTAPTIKSALALSANVSVACPRCGRLTAADMLTDLRTVPPEQREAWGLGGAEFICDACRERLLRQGLSRAEFLAALGAPPEVLALLSQP